MVDADWPNRPVSIFAGLPETLRPLPWVRVTYRDWEYAMAYCERCFRFEHVKGTPLTTLEVARRADAFAHAHTGCSPEARLVRPEARLVREDGYPFFPSREGLLDEVRMYDQEAAYCWTGEGYDRLRFQLFWAQVAIAGLCQSIHEYEGLNGYRGERARIEPWFHLEGDLP